MTQPALDLRCEPSDEFQKDISFTYRIVGENWVPVTEGPPEILYINRTRGPHNQRNMKDNLEKEVDCIGFDQIALAREKYLFWVISGVGEYEDRKTTNQERDCLTNYYISKLHVSLQNRGEGITEREVYESFSDRHHLNDVPDDIESATTMVRKMLGRKETWLIDKIYNDTNERQRKRMTSVITGDS